MKKLILISVLFLLLIHGAKLHAQTTENDVPVKRFEHNILAGLNLGATAPVSIPNNIRKINAWWPEFGPSLGYEIIYHAKNKWGIGASPSLDFKGMGVKDEVLYMHTIINVEDGSSTGEFEGSFSGKNETVVRTAYLSLPVYAVYDFNSKWRAKLGLYGAWLFSSYFKGNVSDGYIRNGGPTGEKIEIEKASFNFGSEMSAIDWGATAGTEWLFSTHFGAYANFSWGFQPVFPSSFRGVDFNLYNMYGTLGVVYRVAPYTH